MKEHRTSVFGAEHTEELGEYAAALGQAQSEYLPAQLDAVNNFLHSNYSTLQAVAESLIGPLTANGLIFPSIQVGRCGDDWVARGVLIHKSGQWMSSMMPLVNPKGDMQGYGSAITFARKFLILSLAGGYSGLQEMDGEDLKIPEKKVVTAVSPRKITIQNQKENGVVVEAEATRLLREASTIEEANKIVALVKLRVSEAAVPIDVLPRVQAVFNARFSGKKKETENV